ncbi:NADP-dependent oxidoreductase [Salibacterium salarium]|uniref:NADP-dependent oxidoreductase n=1 Tax=Salibacterium salarium TaxID=284579 RepID=A0A428MZV0_9BACI|nr:NADP-dependent oxidoreductase [Salibacterium salarium]RSL31703.1 NADP-dependent oxidoreductase [Salibacterium salarium]
MKAVVIDQYGGQDELKEREVNQPSISDDQVLVEIHATSINPIDWKVRAGYLQEILSFDFPVTLGWDAAGVVVKTGKDVTEYKVGDAVFARPATTREGTYAEYVAVDEHLLAAIPEGMSYEEAASIPLAGLTAWQCLVDYADIKKDDNVLIHGGAGGVGMFAIQIAKHYGAYVATTASEENDEFLKSIGADEIVHYKETDFSDALTHFDIVLDSIGGDVQSKSYRVLKENGKLVSIAQPPSEEEANRYGVEADFVWLEPQGEQLQTLGNLYESGQLKTCISESFSFSEKAIKEAHALSETHHVRGKLVIKMK